MSARKFSPMANAQDFIEADFLNNECAECRCLLRYHYLPPMPVKDTVWCTHCKRRCV